MIKWAGGTGDVRGAAAELHQSEEISSFPQIQSCNLKTVEGNSLWGLLPTFDSSGELLYCGREQSIFSIILLC